MANLLSSIVSTVKHWYIPLIIGIVFIVCGIYIFTSPLETYIGLSVIFSISFIFSGIADLVFSIQNASSLRGWGWYLVSGLLSLAMGIYLVIRPDVSMATLPFVVGVTVMFRSFQLLGFSLDLKEAGSQKWGNLAVLSVLGILFSFLLVANPLFTGLSLVTLTALTFIFSGVASCMLAFDLKKVKGYPQKLSNELKNKISALKIELDRELKSN